MTPSKKGIWYKGGKEKSRRGKTSFNLENVVKIKKQSHHFFSFIITHKRNSYKNVNLHKRTFVNLVQGLCHLRDRCNSSNALPRPLKNLAVTGVLNRNIVY